MLDKVHNGFINRHHYTYNQQGLGFAKAVLEVVLYAVITFKLLFQKQCT